MGSPEQWLIAVLEPLREEEGWANGPPLLGMCTLLAKIAHAF